MAGDVADRPLLGIGTSETLRKGMRRAQLDVGAREGTTSGESEESRKLRREVAELKRAVLVPVT